MLHTTTSTETELSPHEECRTQRVNADFSNCLVEERRHRCRYAFVFVDGYLCTHPNHQEFR